MTTLILALRVAPVAPGHDDLNSSRYRNAILCQDVLSAEEEGKHETAGAFPFFFLFCYADFRLKTHPAAEALGLTCHAPFCAIVFNTVSKPEVEMQVETCSDWKSWESRMYYPQSLSAELTNETIICGTCTTTTGSSSPHGPLIWTRGALRGNMAQYIWIYLRKGRLTLLSARTWAPAAPTRSLRPDEAICLTGISWSLG